MFAEFTLDGLPLEVSAQRDHVHRRLGAATLGVSGRSSRPVRWPGRGSPERSPTARTGSTRPPPRLDLSRSALESLSTANSALVARVMGVPRPGPKLREYALALSIGVGADLLIVAAGAARGSQSYTGLMFFLQAGVLGVVFGARLGVLAALAPLVAIGFVIVSSIAVGSETCSPDCAQQAADYLFVAVIVASAAGVTGLLRDRYFPRAA